MKKALLVVAFILVLSIALFAEAKDLSQVHTQIGFDFPTIAKVNHNEDGQIVSLLGANVGLGISYKKYFKPVEQNKINPYWGVGTVAIIMPYIAVGVDYMIDNGLYIGGGVVYLAPEVHFGYMF